MTGDILRAEDVMNTLRVSRAQAYRIMRQMPHETYGRSLRVTAADLERWRANNRDVETARKVRPITPRTAPATPPMFRVVYFIQAQDKGLIKIGHAKDLKRRLASLQASSPVELRLLASTPGAVELERRLHAKFASLRKHGEWFEPRSDLLAFVEMIRKGGRP